MTQQKLPPQVIRPSVADAIAILTTAPGFNDPKAEAALEKQTAPRILTPWRWMSRTVKVDPRVRGINFIIWGEPGIGKTENVKSVMRILNRNVYKRDLSKDAPEDLKGIPKAVKEHPHWWQFWKSDLYTLDAPNRFFMAVVRDRKAALILDDLTNAPQAVQAAGLGLFLNREIEDGKGGIHSIRHVPIVGMANHGAAAAMTELLAPAANRFVHIWTSASEDAESHWLGKKALQIDLSKASRLDKEWNALYSKNHAIFAAFVRANAFHLWEKQPEAFLIAQQYAWCTPRSLEFALRVVTACEFYSDDTMKIDDQRLLEGCIGKAATLKFTNFRRSLNLAKVSDVFARKVNWALCNTSQRIILLQEASMECTTLDELDAVLEAVETVRTLAYDSDDLVILAKDTLIQRARGAIHSKPMGKELTQRIRFSLPEGFSARSNRLAEDGLNSEESDFTILPDFTREILPHRELQSVDHRQNSCELEVS